VSDSVGHEQALIREVSVARYRSLLLHWMTRWFRRPQRPEYEPLPTVQPHQVAVTFGGHATLLLRFPSIVLCVDPMLGRWVGAARRAIEPGIAPGDLQDVGLILITHLHADHFHPATLAKMPKSAMLVGPPGLAAAVTGLGFSRVLELMPGTDVAVAGVSVHAQSVRHGDSDELGGLSYVLVPYHRDIGDGQRLPPSVYVCGDSGYFSGFADIGARFAPDIACLPIGGFLPSSFRDRHMSPADALNAFTDLRSRLLVPIHHGSFALSYEVLDEPARWIQVLAEQAGILGHLMLMQPGQSECIGSDPQGGNQSETLQSVSSAVESTLAPPKLKSSDDPSQHDRIFDLALSRSNVMAMIES
jgi:L-ascorbate metabolism protein UlaG (beta-lactamase superfamily)